MFIKLVRILSYLMRERKKIKKFEVRTGIANENTYWLVFELLWRDYMQFYTMKYKTQLFKLGGPQGDKGLSKYEWKRDKKLLNSWILGTFFNYYHII